MKKVKLRVNLLESIFICIRRGTWVILELSDWARTVSSEEKVSRPFARQTCTERFPEGGMQLATLEFYTRHRDENEPGRWCRRNDGCQDKHHFTRWNLFIEYLTERGVGSRIDKATNGNITRKHPIIILTLRRCFCNYVFSTCERTNEHNYELLHFRVFLSLAIAICRSEIEATKKYIGNDKKYFFKNFFIDIAKQLDDEALKPNQKLCWINWTVHANGCKFQQFHFWFFFKFNVN